MNLSGLLLPVLRDDLALLPGPVQRDGQPTWTLHDPTLGRFHRIDWLTFEVLSRWSLGDPALITESIAATTPLQPQAGEVETVVRFALEQELVRAAGPGAAARLATRLEAREGTWWRWLLHHYLFFRIPLVRPDAWLERHAPRARFLAGRTMLVLTAVALGSGLWAVFRRPEAFLGGIAGHLNAEGLAAYGAAIIAVKVLHELGHAFTARALGCRVPTMGLAFLVLWPVAYTDTNESWRLTDRWDRLRISIAGLATEAGLAAWALLAWALLPDGVAHDVALVLASTSLVSTLAINASPFMRFDGYFILCDLLDFPNLHARSFALARWRLREWLWAVGEAPPETFPPRRAAALIIFAFLTWTYRLIVFTGIAVLVYHFFIKAVGIALFVVEIGWFVAGPVWSEIGEWFRRLPLIRARPAGRRRAALSLIALGLGLLLLALPWPGRISVTGLLRPAETWTLYTPGPARVQAAWLEEGAAIAAGAPLVALDSPALEARRTAGAVRAETLRQESSAAALPSELRANRLAAAALSATATAEWQSSDAEVQRYLLHAPFAGVLRDTDPDLQPGAWVAGREKLGTLIGQGALVETYLDEHQVRTVRNGAAAVFVNEGLEGPTVRLRVTMIDPEATTLLPDGRLAAPQGGHIATRERQGRYFPELAVFRVQLTPESPLGALAGRSWRGRVVVETDAYSRLARYGRQVLLVLRREAGF